MNQRKADMDISKVRELVKMVEESGIEELEVSHGETTIRIQKSAPSSVASVAHPVQIQAAAAPVAVPAAAPASEHIPTHGPAPFPAPASVSAAGTPGVAAAPAPSSTYREVRSPIVGTFYLAPSPGSANFVNVGDKIVAGQTLCIVEAMKVMNEIEAEFGGTVQEIVVADGHPIEAESVLFLVDPD